MFVRIIFWLLSAFSTAALAQSASAPALADDAPDRHIVRKGDTLWGISGHFLKEPWRWPEVWQLNREQISNPHLIYPGQVVVLDRNGASPRLSLARNVSGGPGKLAPKIYSEPSLEPIPSIPQQVIGPFLAEPLVMEADGLDRAPKIIATQEDRVMVGHGNTAYATGLQGDSRIWQVFRPLRPLVDPGTSELLGYEAFFLGTARVLREGEPATIEIVSSKQEIGVGDRLVPAANPDVVAYAPHAPERAVEGRIVGIYAGVNVGETGRNYVVTLNLGRRDGIEIGHVLAMYRHGREVTYRQPDTRQREFYRLPEERYGLVFVFRTFDRVSYALVMDSARPANPNDIVRTP